MTKEVGPHDCAEADKVLDGMREFFVIRLAVDADGLIHGTHHYHGDNLKVEPITPMPTARLCSTVADMVRGLMPQVLEAAHVAAELASTIEEIVNEVKETDDNSSEQDNSDRKPRETSGITGELKRHGTVIH